MNYFLLLHIFKQLVSKQDEGSYCIFNTNHCWVRSVKDMSKNKFWCRN